MQGLDKRVLDWVGFDPAGVCEMPGCEEEARWTDAGRYCLACYKRLPKCSVRGCYRPRAKLQRGDRPVCRHHFLAYEDDTQLAEQRQSWRRSSPIAACANVK